MTKIIKFNKERYPFDKMVADLYDVPLSILDDNLDHTGGDLGADTDSKWHTKFYDRLRQGWPEFIDLYELFIKKELAPMFTSETKMIYQKSPSFRVNQPGGKAIYVPHCDGDKDHKHPPGEINVLMPLTKMYGNNGMYVESMPGLGDYKSREMEFGEVIMFYGNRQRHFNRFNDTKQTRCSFDFRIVPPCNYDEGYELESATMNNKFIIGGYYNIMDK